MNNLTILIAVVALLSGCAIYPRYTVTKASDGPLFLSDFEEKRRVDPDLAEDGRAWNNKRSEVKSICVIHRENKETMAHIFGVKRSEALQPLHQSKEDIDCAVWDSTKTRAHRYGPF